MQSYQDYVDEIQAAVSCPETAEPEFLRDAAALYAEACAAVNDRLRRIGDLLRRGHRSEAIQLSEEPPHVLDQVAVLDFPELPEWVALLVEWNMATPPALQMDIAADLNRAYAEQQPLEPLLRQHRLLALGRGPLSARIEVLRRMIALDSGNEAWRADVEALERARIKEINRASETAARRTDVPALSAMLGELESNGWSVKEVEPTKRSVAALHAAGSKRRAKMLLPEIAHALNEAHLAFDVDAGRDARRRWRDNVGLAELPSNDPQLALAAPALEWLEDQDRREQQDAQRSAAIRRLETALDNDEPAEKIAKLFDRASAFEEPIPEPLRLRAQRRIDSHALSAKRRRRLITAAAVLLLAIVAAVTGSEIWRRQHAAAVVRAVDTLESMLDSENVAAAEEYLSELRETSPRIFTHPDVQSQEDNLDAIVAAEEARRQEFERIMTQLEGMDPTDTSRNRLLSQSRELANTADESKRFNRVRDRFLAADRALAREHQRSLVEQLQSLRNRLTGLEDESEAASSETLPKLRRYIADIDKAQEQHPRAGDELHSQLVPLRTRAVKLISGERAAERARDASERVTNAIGDVSRFVNALKAYARELPESGVARNIGVLSSEGNLWAAVQDWSKFLPELEDVHEATPATGRRLLARGDRLLDEHPAVDLAEGFQSRRDYLASVAARDAAVGKLAALLRDPLLYDVWMLHEEDGPKYYCAHEPADKGNQWEFAYYTGFDLSQKTTSRLKSSMESVDKAPQAKLVDEVASKIRQRQLPNWEKNFSQIIRQTQEQAELDSILKIVLLQRFVSIASEGSTALEAGYADYAASLRDLNVDLATPWMNPDDDEAVEERNRARALIRQLPSLDDAERVTANELQAIRDAPRDTFEWVGWLTRTPAGGWTVAHEENSSPSGELCVVIPPRGDDSSQLSSIGRAASGDVRVRGYSQSELMPGRPVFLRVSAD